MINRYKVRRLFAPTAGLWIPALIVLLGLLLFFSGMALSIRDYLTSGLEGFGNWAGNVLKNAVGDDRDVSAHLMGGGFLVLGFYLIFIGMKSGVRRIMETLTPGRGPGLVTDYVRRQQLAQGPHIVALGGGTGLSTLLRGLKHHSSNITAIVTVTDDGGSSGKLIKDKGMIPPGDIRNCLVALADAEKAMTDLFQHRFKKDSGSLSGHSMGNLLIAALLDQSRGDFEQAVESASAVLAIRGKVIPSTLEHVSLRAEVEDGPDIFGETAIVEAGRRIKRIHLEPANVQAHPKALEAIADADIILIGPGSVFTSVIPNLLVPGVAEAIRASQAPKVYICNVMTQPGESDTFSASEHVSAILNNVEQRIFDFVMLNSAAPSESALETYREADQHWVEPDMDRIRAMGLRIIQGNFMSETDVVRHDAMRVAERVLRLVGR
ncbi:MAG TPA: YvcK family protein [Fimbriimonadaceae bacterium]|nr:YvcK family protein [Fimbriimonadaceae bacterium]